ncbi:MAG: hypothetical protein E4H40_02150 [Candidatus Brocadiia bacterium]|nr:MAG: hypothetical protein E4H40_02150 [Candidatus Brocadiia bacterium]
MVLSSPQKQNRRQFFRSLVRYGTLGLIGAAGASAIVKRKKLQDQGICTNQGICTHCEVLDQCGLPQALSAKNVLGKQSSDTE